MLISKHKQYLSLSLGRDVGRQTHLIELQLISAPPSARRKKAEPLSALPYTIYAHGCQDLNEIRK